MTPRTWLVRWLLLAYPAAWREEYGAELANLLLARPLTVGTVVNVLGAALGQRMRAAEPSTHYGLGAMVVIAAGLVWNVARATPAWWLATPLQSSALTFPTVVVAPMASQVYAILLVICGWQTSALHGGGARRAGLAAMRVTIIAGIPVMITGFLMLIGMMSIVQAGAADASIAREHGLVYTSLASGRHAVTPAAVFFAPLLQLPQAYLYGAMGAWFRPKTKTKTKTSNDAVTT